MDKSSKIKSLLRGITGTDKARYPFRLMEVVSVEGDLCRAKMDAFEIPGIHLASITNGAENGVLITPMIGSAILVADISNGELRELVAIAYSEIDSIQIHKGDTTLFTNDTSVTIEVGESFIEVTDGRINLRTGEDTIEIGTGNNSADTKMSNIAENEEEDEKDTNPPAGEQIIFNGGSQGGLIRIEKLTDKLNALTEIVNDFITAYKSHNHTHPQGNTTGFLTGGTVNSATSFNKADYENTKIKH
ncbi:MAG: hypothetical protein LIP01_11015 [Tannerellaceae bacterium]|nr:hypothetical protein [Tannerellaceae bacterium]